MTRQIAPQANRSRPASRPQRSSRRRRVSATRSTNSGPAPAISVYAVVPLGATCCLPEHASSGACGSSCILLAPKNEFLAESVTFADPGHRWERSFTQVTENPGSTVLVMPEELGPAPAGVSIHDRCNRWILYSALSQGLRRASFITLWNGEPGDGPGGTQNMIELVRKLTGRQPLIIDPATR